MTTTLEQLTKRIEQLMREHVEGVQLAAMQAIARAVVRENRMRRAQPASSPRTTGKQRRPESEIAALSDRLYEEVRKRPGELMAVYSAELSATANDLQMPMRRLRSRDLVHSVGERHQTRYFPVGK